jgi:hypothetical protein
LATPEYIQAIGKALDKVYDPPKHRWAGRRSRRRNVIETREAQDLRIVVMSDLHRGTFDGADDFRRAHRAYRAALGWYLEHDYELWLLGDVEELWENAPAKVVDKWKDVLRLEQGFVAPAGPGLRRFFGNHDMDWSNPRIARKHLGEWIHDTRILESIRLEVRDGGVSLGVLFFVHGHQGTPGSDGFAFFSRFVVRFVWRAVQRTQGWIATTPAESPEIRHKHDAAMFEWARSRARRDPVGSRPILIAGHTHHPVFPGKGPALPTDEAVAALRADLEKATDAGARAHLRASLNLQEAIRWEPRFEAPENTPPCYFNTGCCSFPDADITCIEITETVRLVRWLKNDGGARPHQLTDPRGLRELFGELDRWT